MPLTIRKLIDADVPAGEALFRESFRTFLNIPDRMMGDSSFVGARARRYPDGAFVAEQDGTVIGVVLSMNWGSVTVCGPLCSSPREFNPVVGKLLIEQIVSESNQRGATYCGGYTFSHSRHPEFFKRSQFYPRYLTATLSRSVPRVAPAMGPDLVRFSEVSEEARAEMLASARRHTDRAYGGLDLTLEITSVQRCGMGETIFLMDGPEVAALAVMHAGPGTEAGSGVGDIRFASAGVKGDESRLDRLLQGCEVSAIARGCKVLRIGVNTASTVAYRHLLSRQFQATTYGVLLARPSDDAYHTADRLIFDDYR